MSDFRLLIDNPIPLILLTPTPKIVSGVTRNEYPTIEEALKNEENIFFGNFKTYGGTEREVNGVYSIEDTGNVETWFRPDIKANCRVAVADTNKIYDILGDPENINMRNQFLKFKVRRVKGGA